MSMSFNKSMSMPAAQVFNESPNLIDGLNSNNSLNTAEYDENKSNKKSEDDKISKTTSKSSVPDNLNQLNLDQILNDDDGDEKDAEILSKCNALYEQQKTTMKSLQKLRIQCATQRAQITYTANEIQHLTKYYQKLKQNHNNFPKIFSCGKVNVDKSELRL